MDPIITTPRLKLTLVTKADEGSQELEWLHELRSDAQVTNFSVLGQSKTLEDTIKAVQPMLPEDPASIDPLLPKQYKIAYLVHEVLPYEPSSSEPPSESPSRFIGAITIRTYPATNSLVMPLEFFPASLTAPSTLTVELGYLYLPRAWGKGYATEALAAAFGACRRAPEVFAPYKNVFVRAVVNDENPGSRGVMRKSELSELGTWIWEGDKIWLMGQWITRCRLWVYGGWLLGGGE